MCGVVGVADGLADPATGGYLVPIRCCPLADLGQLVGVAALLAARRAAAVPAAHLASCGDVVGERFAQLLGVVVGEVDLVVVAVEGELDVLAAVFDGFAGEVVNELGGDFLCHSSCVAGKRPNPRSETWP